MADALTTINAGSISNRHVAGNAALEQSKFKLRQNSLCVVDLFSAKVWDARQTNLPGTPASDDLGIVTGTFGSAAPQVQTGDLKAAGSTTRRLGIVIPLPDNYESGETIKIRLIAGMKTTVADTAATIDLEAYQLNDDGALSADLCTTAAQTINSLVYGSKDFTIDPSGLVAGVRLDCRVSILVNDAATLTAVIGVLHSIIRVLDLRP